MGLVNHFEGSVTSLFLGNVRNFSQISIKQSTKIRITCYYVSFHVHMLLNVESDERGITKDIYPFTSTWLTRNIDTILKEVLSVKFSQLEVENVLFNNNTLSIYNYLYVADYEILVNTQWTQVPRLEL